MTAYILDTYSDFETFTGAKGATITRGDLVSVGGSKIIRRFVGSSERWGVRLVRADGGNQAPSVWTKQFKGVNLVKTVAEQEAVKPTRRLRTPKAEIVVADLPDDQKGLLAAIAAAVVDDDSVTRNRAIVAAANAGLSRSAIAAAAGLNKVGNIIRAAREEVTA